jgi:hypothetical protein
MFINRALRRISKPALQQRTTPREPEASAATPWDVAAAMRTPPTGAARLRSSSIAA